MLWYRYFILLQGRCLQRPYYPPEGGIIQTHLANLSRPSGRRGAIYIGGIKTIMGTHHQDQFPFIVDNQGCKRCQITVILTGCIVRYETCFCNPWLSGFACYSRTFRLSFLPGKPGFRDEVSFRRWYIFPEGYCISFREPGAEALHLLKPCDSISERTFPVFVDY